MVDASAALATQFRDMEQRRLAATFGMWVFLATEVLFFGGLFSAYFIYRHAYTTVFNAAGQHLDPILGGINTALLITSSLTMTLAERALTGRRWMLTVLLAFTALLGTAFLAIKGIEYSREYDQGLMPLFGQVFRFEGPPVAQAKLFFTFYFLMTGLHALHLSIGIGLIAWLMGLALFSVQRLELKVMVVGLYWHFIDVVWLFLFATLYLGTRHG